MKRFNEKRAVPNINECGLLARLAGQRRERERVCVSLRFLRRFLYLASKSFTRRNVSLEKFHSKRFSVFFDNTRSTMPIITDPEDMVLTVIDEYFQANGWTVSSLQFDGLHVEHLATDTHDEMTGEWVQLQAAIRGAEQAVQSKLGYTIQLKEKELYERAGAE